LSSVFFGLDWTDFKEEFQKINTYLIIKEHGRVKDSPAFFVSEEYFLKSV
jgi:hypothetical protein